jgi:hypothetical protein
MAAVVLSGAMTPTIGTLPPADGTDEDLVEGTASPAALTPQVQRREPEGDQPQPLQ